MSVATPDPRHNPELQYLRLIYRDLFMTQWPHVVDTSTNLLRNVRNTRIQLVSLLFHMDIDVLRQLGQLPDSLDLSSIHKLQERGPLELRIHVVIEPCGSPPMPSRSTSPYADGLAETTVLVGFRRVFEPFNRRGALHITKTIC